MNKEYTPTKKEEKLISFKQSQFYTVLTILAFAFGVLVGYFIWGNSPTAVAAPENTAAQPAGIQNEPKRYDIPTEGFPSIGPEDAEIVLVEFSDFGCSYCAKWHNETFVELLEAYPDQIRFVYYDVPFRAFSASEAAKCAEEQDAFWEYHDRLFSYEYGLEGDAFVKYAEELNLDMDAFNKCMSNHSYQSIIQENMDFATKLGVNSTPTFFVNGIPLVGAQPIDAFKKLIDLELASQ